MFSTTTWSSSLILYITTSTPLPISSSSSFSPRIRFKRSSVLIWTMATGRQLPKFGEWDATNPASAQGFTVIFNKACDDKKIKKTAVAGPESLVTPPVNVEPHRRSNHRNERNPREKKKWLCFR